MRKPRNPYVVAALHRKAGAHEPSKSGKRFAEKRETARQVKAFQTRDGRDSPLPLAA